MPSTWSTTGPVSRTPASRASDLAVDARARGQLAPLPGQRAQLVAVERLGGSAQRLGELEHRVDLLALPAHQQVDRPGRDRRLLQLLDLGGQRLVADLLWRPALRASVKSSADPAYSRSAIAVSSSTRDLLPAAGRSAAAQAAGPDRRTGRPRARAARTGRAACPARPTKTVPTGLPLLLVGAGHAGRRQRPVDVPAARAPPWPSAPRSRRRPPRAAVTPSSVALHLGRVGDHPAGERRRGARRGAQQGGQLAAGERLGATHGLAARQQGAVQRRLPNRSWPDASAVRALARDHAGPRVASLPPCRARSRTTPPSATATPRR